MTATAKDETNQISEFEITHAARIAGAIAVIPEQQYPSNQGWVLMPDADTAQIEGIKIVDMKPSDFIKDGKCFEGDDEFNAWIINHAPLSFKSIEWNDDLVGWEIELSNGKPLQVQYEKMNNVLHADHGEYYPIIDTENEYGLDLTEDETDQVKNLIKHNTEIQDKCDELKALEDL